MTQSRSRAGSGSNLDIRDAVAGGDLPRAAKAAKDALDRGAHVQLAVGILLGLGLADVREKSAAAVCGCFLDMLTCRSEDRRTAAARLLMTAMRSVTLPMPDAQSGRAEIVSASGADIAVAQPNPDRAVGFARAMTKTMGVCEVADVLATSCLRVSKLHGTARNPSALAAMSRCALFGKSGVAVQAAARVLLSAAVRSMYVLVPDSASVSDALVKALAATPKLKIDKPVPRKADDDGRGHDDIFGSDSAADDDYAPSTDDKLSILWTFVPRDDSAIAAVARAAAEAAESSAPPEIKVIDGRGFLPPPTGGLARVRKFE
jgi:hypothetical protein